MCTCVLSTEWKRQYSHYNYLGYLELVVLSANLYSIVYPKNFEEPQEPIIMVLMLELRGIDVRRGSVTIYFGLVGTVFTLNALQILYTALPAELVNL